MRHYPALDLSWSGPLSEDAIERALACIDDDHPSAIEERENVVRVFFASPVERACAIGRLAESQPRLTCTPIDVPDEEWAERSQTALGPIEVDRLVVVPHYSSNAGDGPFIGETDIDGRLVVRIIPSMGFGTGHHASTRLCLALLQQVPVEGARVLDAGTGSGVLALAAWRLGAREVVAADHDADALESAADNLTLNGAGAIALRQSDLTTDAAGLAAGGRFDVLCANLTGGLLIAHATTLTRLASPRGRLVVSGVLTVEESVVVGAFAGAGWTVARRAAEDEWIGLIFKPAA